MFTKQDGQFDDMAADPARRREGITALALRRNIFLCCAVGMTLLAFIFFMSNRSPGAAAVGFAAVLQWILFSKFESDLRLLRVIERLHGPK
jgi:hypothetical protein